uniref:NR LBD domain-containing protein n=1 Tax=Caenorhabditis tropicalis TaxID=1561998 RepID=A0A1I7V3Z2_9PELO
MHIDSDLEILEDWCDKWQMSVAPTKCEAISFFHKKRLNNTNNQFSINDERLPTVEKIRDLGVILNSSLTFSDHFATTLRKAHQRINIFFNVLRRSKMDIFVKCFIIYIRPILEYGTIVSSPVIKEQIKLLEGVQKSFLYRCCKKFNFPYVSYFDCLREYNLESLEYRRLISDLVFMYKTLVSREVDIAHNLFISPHYHNCLRRHSYYI